MNTLCHWIYTLDIWAGQSEPADHGKPQKNGITVAIVEKEKITQKKEEFENYNGKYLYAC